MRRRAWEKSILGHRNHRIPGMWDIWQRAEIALSDCFFRPLCWCLENILSYRTALPDLSYIHMPKRSSHQPLGYNTCHADSMHELIIYNNVFDIPKTPGYVLIQREDFHHHVRSYFCREPLTPTNRCTLRHDSRLRAQHLSSFIEAVIDYSGHCLPTQPINHLSLKTFGFQPSFNSASRWLASSNFFTSTSILSLALRILLCK